MRIQYPFKAGRKLLLLCCLMMEDCHTGGLRSGYYYLSREPFCGSETVKKM